jgi:hypothetical protein
MQLFDNIDNFFFWFLKIKEPTNNLKNHPDN